MHNIKKTSQKITIVAIVLIILIQLMQPIVQAVELPEKYQNLPDGVQKIEGFSSEYSSMYTHESQLYYVYTEGNTKHAVAVDELTTANGNKTYQVSENSNKGYINGATQVDPDASKLMTGNSFGIITGDNTTGNNTTTSTSNGTGTNSTSGAAQGKRLSELDVKDGESKTRDGQILKMNDDKYYAIYYIGNEAYGIEFKYHHTVSERWNFW